MPTTFEQHFGIRPSDTAAHNEEFETLSRLIDHLLLEKYRPQKTPLAAKIPFVHPHVVPAKIRSAVSKWIKGSAKKSAGEFPTFPEDFTVDILKNYLLAKYTSAEKPLPYWPDNKKFAVALTHDVDTDFIFKHRKSLDRFLEIEENLGFRSAWFFVSNKYKIDEGCLRELIARGHEVGFHGDTHDFRLPYLKENKMRRRLDRCRPFLERFSVKGGRSPLFLRTPTFLHVLQDYLEYDTSFHDTTIGSLSGLREGCCSCFPFYVGKLLEIPTTIPEEFLLKMQGMEAPRVLATQVSKCRKVAEYGGVVSILTHPEPQISANPEGLQLYQSLLEAVRSMDAAWLTLPKDLALHWKDRLAAKPQFDRIQT